MLREFRNRYRDILDAVDEARPGFWTEMADELRRIFEERVTTCGAIVREFPAQEKAAIQAVVSTQDATTETADATGREAAARAGPEESDPESNFASMFGEAPVHESPWDSPRTQRSSPAPSD